MTQPTYGENQPALANPVVVIPVRDAGERPFKFTGGAGSFFLMGLLSGLLTVATFGIGYPWAVCMRYRWRCEHTLIYGQQPHFTGHGLGLFGQWIKWWCLCLVTIGIYLFWVVPRLTRWIVEHQQFPATVGIHQPSATV